MKNEQILYLNKIQVKDNLNQIRQTNFISCI